MTDVTQLFGDLVRAETRLYNSVDDRLRAAHGLTVGQYMLLQIIADRERCRVYDIVREVAITVGAASKAVDRLERAGWCRRIANPDDRRSSLLALTPAGTTLLAQARPTFVDEISARTSDVVTADSLEQTAVTLAALRTSLELHQRDRDSRAVVGPVGSD